MAITGRNAHLDARTLDVPKGRFGMMLRIGPLAALWLFVGAAGLTAGARAQGFSTFSAQDLPDRISEANLVAGADSIAPGQSIWVALHLSLLKGWHTYWRNPGDSGAPTLIEWRLPPGFTAGPVVWPYPHLFWVGPIPNFGYEDEAWLLTQITAPADLPENTTVELGIDAQYLVCADICVPQHAMLNIELPVSADGAAAEATRSAGPLKTALSAVPIPAPWAATFAVDGDLVQLRFDTDGAPSFDTADVTFFPQDFGVIDHAADQVARIEDGALVLALRRDTSSGEEHSVLNGVLVLHGSEQDRAFQVHAEPAEQGARE